MKKTIMALIWALLINNLHGQYSGSLNIGQNELIFSTAAGFDIVRIQNCPFNTQVGEPQLPMVLKKYVIPYEAEVTGITITNSNGFELTGQYFIIPVQPPAIPDGSLPEPFTTPSIAVYHSITPYPNILAEIHEVSFFMDYKIVTVAFYPLEYHPLDKKLFLHNTIEFTVNYTLGTIPFNLSESISDSRKEAIQALIAGMVENPADVTIVSGGVNTVPDSDSPGLFPTSEQYPTNLGVTADYLIITSNTLRTAFQEFIDWKNKKGIPVVLATLENDIMEKYNGCDTAEKIRNFIIDFKAKRGPGFFILMGGDINVIPTRMALCNGVLSPFDLYYSATNGNWNADGDHVYGEPGDQLGSDKNPSCYLGRIPVRTPDDISNYTKKVLEYEKLLLYQTTTPIDPGFRNRMLEMVGSSGDNNLTWKSSVMAQVNSFIPLSSTMQLTMLNDTPNSNPPAYVTELELGKNAAITELNKQATDGYNLCYHLDHSGPFTMGTSDIIHGEKLIIPDVEGLENQHTSHIFLTSGCEANRFSENSISKAFLNNRLGGSLIFIGKSVSTGAADFETGQFIDNVFNNNSTLQNHAGIYFYSTFQISTHKEDFNLLGDPELPIWKNSPPTPVSLAASALTLQTGTNSFIVTVTGLPINQDAMLCISKTNEVYKKMNFTGTGAQTDIPVMIEPKTTGIVNVILSIKNHLPVELQIPVVANPGPFLFSTDCLVDDYSTGTIGNGNEQADAGEVFKVNITITNSGQTASEIIYQAKLESLSNINTVPDQYSDFQNVLPLEGNLVTSDQPFKIQIATGLNDQALASFRLSMPLQFYPACTTKINIPIHAPKMTVYTMRVVDGNNNIIEPNETVDLFLTLKNDGSGKTNGIQATLTSGNGNIDSFIVPQVDYSDINPYSQGENTVAFRFHVNPNWNQTTPLLVNLSLVPDFGKTWTISGIRLTPPPKTDGMQFTSTSGSINLWWNPVLAIKGYNVYRSLLPDNGFEKINDHVIEGISKYDDLNLSANSVFYYRVSCVSNDGMEGPLSDLPALKAWTTIPLHAGWPVTNINPALGFSTTGSPMTDDINKDGQKEIFLNIGWEGLDASTGGVLGFSATGNAIPGYEKPDSEYVEAFYSFHHACSKSTPAIVDINNDGNKELIITTSTGNADPASDAKKTIVFSTTQIDQGNSPHIIWAASTNRDFRGAVLASFEGDEMFETAVKGDWASEFFTLNNEGLNYSPDGYTTNWPVANNLMLEGNGSPVLADIDLDGNKEYIIGMRGPDAALEHTGIYAWNLDGTPYSGVDGLLYKPANPQWQVFRMDAPMAVANINEDDAAPEIICVAADICHNLNSNDWCEDPSITAHVFILNNMGVCIQGWGYDDHLIQITNHLSTCGARGLPSPSIGDINRDGHPEIVIAGFERIYAWDNTGTPLTNFPIAVTGLSPQYITPLLADVDNDDQTDIVVASNSRNDNYNGIYAYGQNGISLIGFPLHIGRVDATPCIDDIDNDGKAELIASSGNKIYVWDCDGRADGIIWGKPRLNTANNAVCDNGCDLASDPITINSNTIWTNDRFIGGTVTISPGAQLTIKCKVNFSSVAQIIVQPGGRLIIDGATLTSSCINPWLGIRVNGNNNLSQNPSSNQGYVKVVNFSLIEHANPAILSENGGIVIASDATFKNNHRSVILSNYPSFSNTSTFTRCTFTLDDKDLLDGNEFLIGAQFISPLAIYGCTFENNVPANDVTANLRATGIIVSNADLVMSATSAYNPSPDPLEVKNNIKGLYYGIYNLRSGNRYTTSIRYTNFMDNLRGLYQSGFNGISYTTVAKNTFQVLRPELAPGFEGYGMYLNNCSGYTVEENDFYSEGPTPAGTGLIINESGPTDNQIYNNKFHNLDQGSKPQGQNRLSTTNGLCYRCNDFYSNNNDILIVSDNPGLSNQGIATSQGSSANASKNTFTMLNNSSTTLYDIHNPFTEIDYYYDNNPPGIGTFLYPEPTVGVLKVAVYSQYNKVVDCPSHFGSSNIDEETSALAVSGSKSDSLNQVLDEVVDGGSTENLSGEVLSSTPPQAMETSEQLLTDSPYLSDSVMKAAIAKEEVLSNAMIRDVLVENPQSAKSIEILNKLDQRFIPMPDSMMADIMEGKNLLGPKEIKEIELLGWNQRYAHALKSLTRIYSEDSAGVYGTDSLKLLLEHDGTLNSCYDRVSLYFRDELYETGFATLDSIPFKYDLTGSQMVQHNQMEQLFEMMYQVDTSQLKIGSLDSIQIQTLMGMAVQDAALPGAYARNLLIMGGHLDYDEPIIDPGTLKVSKVWKRDDPSTIKSSDYLLKVYPNPSNSYFIVEYRQMKGIKGSGKTSIVIADIYGKEIMDLQADRYYDQVVVPTSGFSSGSYFVALKVDGAVKKTVKISVVK